MDDQRQRDYDAAAYARAQKKLATQGERSSYERSGDTRSAKTRAKIYGSFVRLMMPPGPDAQPVARRAAALGVTVSRVTTHAGVSNASFYKNFKSVDDLLDTVAKQMGEALWKKSHREFIKMVGQAARYDRPHLLALNIIFLVDALFRYPNLTKVENASSLTKGHIGHGLAQALANRDSRMRDRDWRDNNEPEASAVFAEAYQLSRFYVGGALAWFETYPKIRARRRDLAELMIRQCIANFAPMEDVALQQCLALVDRVWVD